MSAPRRAAERIGIRRAGPWGMIRMKQVGQKLDALHHARPRLAEIRGVDRKHATALDGGQFIETGLGSQPIRSGHCFGAAHAAGHNNNNVRRSVSDGVPGNADGVFPFAAEDVVAARDFDHFGDPVAGTVEGIEPFGAEDAWAWKVHVRAAHFLEAMIHC